MSRACLMILVMVLGSVLASMARAAEPAPPNILFILTDDQGWSSLGCYGNTIVPTPHLDRLAEEGMRLTDAYVMPQCTPTRAALLTGQHTARTGLWHVLASPWYGYPWAPVREPAFREGLPHAWFNLPKGLRSAGYATGMAGKWHLSTNEDGNYVALHAQAAGAFGFDYVAPRGPGSQNEGDKWVDHLTDEAIAFIRAQREKPWFFYLAHHTLHGRVSAPPELIAKHRERGAPEEGLNNATYLAAIEHLNNSIGRLMAALDELKLRERTLVVFLSDNGGVAYQYDPAPFTTGEGTDRQLRIGSREFSNAPLRATKGSPYEGGIRVPCVVRWPGVIKKGSVSSTPVHVVDWLPTLLAAAGAKLPDDYVCDGVNLIPLMRGEALPERALCWYMPLYDLRWGATPCAMIRRGDWKLIEYFGDHYDASGEYQSGRRLELFNLRHDLGETKNLASQEAERAATLVAELHGLLRDCHAEIPGANPHHDPAQAFKETKVKPEFVK